MQPMRNPFEPEGWHYLYVSDMRNQAGGAYYAFGHPHELATFRDGWDSGETDYVIEYWEPDATDEGTQQRRNVSLS